MEQFTAKKILEQLAELRETLRSKGQESKEYIERYDAVLGQLDTIPSIPASLAKIVYPLLKQLQIRNSTPLQTSPTAVSPLAACPEDFDLQKYIEHLQVIKEILTTESKASCENLQLKTPNLLKLLAGFCSILGEALGEPSAPKKAKRTVTIDQTCLERCACRLENSKEYKDLVKCLKFNNGKFVCGYLRRGVETVGVAELHDQTGKLLKNLSALRKTSGFENDFLRYRYIENCWCEVLQDLDGGCVEKSPSNVISLLIEKLSVSMASVKGENVD